MALSVDRAVTCGAEGSGYAPTEGQAEGLAVDACRHYRGRKCQVIFSKCDEVIVTPGGGGTPGGGAWKQCYGWSPREHQYITTWCSSSRFSPY